MRTYEGVRADMPPGDDRTFRMGVLMSEVRSVAGIIGVTEDLVASLFEAGREGDRVVALTLIEAEPLPGCLPIVLDGISNSRTAFEQFQALRAAEELLPLLDRGGRQRLGKVLEHEYRDFDGKGIREDTSRLYAIRHMLAQIEGFGSTGFTSRSRRRP